MTAKPERLWIACAHQPVYRCGGWAWARGGAAPAGVAGGARNTTAERTALSALVSALGGLAAQGPIKLATDSAEILSWSGLLSGAADARPPSEDLDLWAQVQKALAGRPLTVTPATAAPDTPQGFAAAWAELARDKAKASGAFTAAIPKPNLAKVAGLAG